MKKPDMACTTIRQTPLHVPDTGAYIRQGLSNMFDAPTIPEGVAYSPLSPITCLSEMERRNDSGSDNMVFSVFYGA
jgi:hypothetical protein